MKTTLMRDRPSLLNYGCSNKSRVSNFVLSPNIVLWKYSRSQGKKNKNKKPNKLNGHVSKLCFQNKQKQESSKLTHTHLLIVGGTMHQVAVQLTGVVSTLQLSATLAPARVWMHLWAGKLSHLKTEPPSMVCCRCRHQHIQPLYVLAAAVLTAAMATWAARSQIWHFVFSYGLVSKGICQRLC